MKARPDKRMIMDQKKSAALVAERIAHEDMILDTGMSIKDNDVKVEEKHARAKGGCMEVTLLVSGAAGAFTLVFFRNFFWKL